jgi:hypothetical protein
MANELKPLSTIATFTFSNGEVLEEIGLVSFTGPRDSQSGVPMGKSLYKPFSIVKPIDEASEKLNAALKSGQRLRTVVITVDRLQHTLTGVFVREITQRPSRLEEISMECELMRQQHLLGVPTRVQFLKPF